MVAKVIRIDALSERYPYRDDGCYIAPHCLDCPLPRCVYEDPHQFQRAAREERRREVAALVARGIQCNEVARRLQIGLRTVHRDLQEIRWGAPTVARPADTSSATRTSFTALSAAGERRR